MIQTKQSGFTLLELILVVAIIATISVIGIFAYQQRLINFQSDKAALQMQQWLEGGIAYYVQNGKWPAIPNGFPQCTINKLLEGNQALCGPTASVVYVTPGSIDTPPWNGRYILSQPANTAVFQVTAVAVPKNIGVQLAARLPNTTMSANAPYTVTATVTTPSQGSGSGYAVVFASDQLTDGMAIPYPGFGNTPPCPTNTIPNISVAIAEFQSPVYNGFTEAPTDAYAKATADHPAPNTTKWTVNLAATWGTGPSAVTSTAGRILAIVNCKPNTPSLSTTNNSSSSGNFKY